MTADNHATLFKPYMLSSMLGDVALPAAQLLMRKVKKTTVSKTSEDCPAGRCTERLQHISVCVVLNSNITDEVSGMQMHMVAMCESYYNLCLRPISLLQMQPVRLAARIRLILCQISSTHQTETRGSQARGSCAVLGMTADNCTPLS